MAGIIKHGKHIAGCSHDPVPEHIKYARPGNGVRLNICSPDGHQLSQAMSYVDAVQISQQLKRHGIGSAIDPDLRFFRRAFHDAIEEGNVKSLVLGCPQCGEVRFVVLVMPMPPRKFCFQKVDAANGALPQAPAPKIQQADDLPATLPLLTAPLVSTGEAANSAVSTAETCADRRREIRVARHKCVGLICQLTTLQLGLLLCELAAARASRVLAGAVRAVKWLFSPINEDGG